MSRLKDKYQKEVVPALTKEFGYKNVMAVPRIHKVVVNMGLGEATSNAKLVDVGADELARITGQKPVTQKSKKSIAAFKVRKGTKPLSINQAASKLMADPNIHARVGVLREPVAKKAMITLESHLEDLQRLRNMAAKEKQYSAAITAEVARGKASGVVADKIDISGTMAVATLDVGKLSAATLRAIMAAKDAAKPR